jgi:hypothetical protein
MADDNIPLLPRSAIAAREEKAAQDLAEYDLGDMLKYATEVFGLSQQLDALQTETLITQTVQDPELVTQIKQHMDYRNGLQTFQSNLLSNSLTEYLENKNPESASVALMNCTPELVLEYFQYLGYSVEAGELPATLLFSIAQTTIKQSVDPHKGNTLNLALAYHFGAPRENYPIPKWIVLSERG